VRTAVNASAVLRYDPVQLLGVVTLIDDDGHCVVRCETTDWHVQRAASCLLAPAPGDTVLLSGPVPEQTWLIAIIRQAQPATARLQTQGDLVIASQHGSISLEAAQAVALQGREDITLQTPALAVRADDAQCAIGNADYIGGTARFAIGAVSLIGRTCEVVMDRISQMAHNVLRLTQDTEQLRAGRIDHQAEHSARLHAQHTLVTATDLVKVDADQIHMG